MQILKNQQLFIVLLAVMFFVSSGYSTVSADTNSSLNEQKIKLLMDEIGVLQEKLNKLNKSSDANISNILGEQDFLTANYLNEPTTEAVKTEQILRSTIAETKKNLIEIDKEIKKNKGETRDASRYIYNLLKVYTEAGETQLAEKKLGDAYFTINSANGNAKKLLSDLKDFRSSKKEISFFKKADEKSTKIYIVLLEDGINALEKLSLENYDKKSLTKTKKVLNDAKKVLTQSNKDYKQEKYALAYWRIVPTYITVVTQIDVLKKTKRLSTKATSGLVVETSAQIEKTKSLLSYLEKVNINNFSETFIGDYNEHLRNGIYFLDKAKASFDLSDYSSAYKNAIEAYNQLNKASQMLKG
jgi:hypothetical protein